MNNTLFYVFKWIYSQSSYHWYVRRFKYAWHKETVELTDGWFCWYRSWRGNLSTVNWQITETKERSITSLAWFRQKKTTFLDGIYQLRFSSDTRKKETDGTIWSRWEYSCAGEPTDCFTHPKARNADSAVSAQKYMQERAAWFLCWDRHGYKGGFLKKKLRPSF